MKRTGLPTFVAELVVTASVEEVVATVVLGLVTAELIATTSEEVVATVVLAVILVLVVLAVILLAVIEEVVTTIVLAVVLTIAIVAAIASADSEADAIILGTALGNRHDDRLVIGSRSHGAETVVASGQAALDIGRQQTIAVALVIDALEEDKLGRVKRLGRVGITAGVLDSDVSVANDVTVAVDILGSGVVGVVRVGKGTRRKVDHLDRDGEVGVGLEVVAILRGCEDTGNHVAGSRDVTHRDTVARPAFVLLTICQDQALTKVDEVRVIACNVLATIIKVYG